MPSFVETMKENVLCCVLKSIVNTGVFDTYIYIYIFNANYRAFCIFLSRNTSASVSILF